MLLRSHAVATVACSANGFADLFVLSTNLDASVRKFGSRARTTLHHLIVKSAKRGIVPRTVGLMSQPFRPTSMPLCVKLRKLAKGGIDPNKQTVNDEVVLGACQGASVREFG